MKKIIISGPGTVLLLKLDRGFFLVGVQKHQKKKYDVFDRFAYVCSPCDYSI